MLKAIQPIYLPFSIKYKLLERIWQDNEKIVEKLPKSDWIDEKLPYCAYQMGSNSARGVMCCNSSHYKEKIDAVLTTKFNHELNNEFSERLKPIKDLHDSLSLS